MDKKTAMEPMANKAKQLLLMMFAKLFNKHCGNCRYWVERHCLGNMKDVCGNWVYKETSNGKNKRIRK